MHWLNFLVVFRPNDAAVKHYHIRKTNDGKYFITENYAFSTLPELVVFHKQDPHGWNITIITLCSIDHDGFMSAIKTSTA